MNTRILVVDDDPGTRRFLSSVLSRKYLVQEASGGAEALQTVATWHPDVVALDVSMPEMDGLEACRVLKSTLARVPPVVIVVSTKASGDDLYRAFESGADDYLIKPIESHDLLSRIHLHVQVRTALANMANVAALDLASELPAIGRTGTRHIAASEDVAAFALAKLAETRENETEPHLARLRDYAFQLMQSLQEEASGQRPLNDKFIANLIRSIPLHDIGKVGVPSNILRKPGRLTTREFDIMKRHTEVGAHVLDWSARYTATESFLAVASDVARWHHERWNGAGYPDGLRGESIPLAARIVAVVDVFEALTSPRPDRLAWSLADARAYIEANTGTHFDPTVARAFLNSFDAMAQIHRHYLPARADIALSESVVPRFAVVAAT